MREATLWKELATAASRGGFHARPKGDGFELIRPDGATAMVVSAGGAAGRMAEVIAAMKEAGIWQEGQ